MDIAYRLPALHTKILRDMESIPWRIEETTKQEAIQKRSANNHFQSKGKPTKFTDEQILEIRALHQFCHWNYEMLAERYNSNRKDISRCAEYYSRTKLVPNKSHIPLVDN